MKGPYIVALTVLLFHIASILCSKSASTVRTFYEFYSICCSMSDVIFMPPEGTSGGILKSHCPSVTNRVSAISHKLLKQI